MATITFKKINKEMLNYLTEITEENNCKVESIEWRSKYNSYVVYDYEPFCSDGFYINVVIKGRKSFLNFIKYLYEKQSQAIDYLEVCFHARKEMIGVL